MATEPRKPVSDGTTKPAGRSAPVDVKAMLAAQAERFKNRVQAPGGDKIRLTKKKTFKLPDGVENGGPLRVVILDVVSQNMYFDRPYSEGEITPPACFAIGPDPKTMVPSDKSPDKQSDECADCPMNEFGSRGKGKACRNSRVLAVVEATGREDAPVMLLQVPPTSLRNFDAYVNEILATNEYGIIGAVTEISFDPDSEYQQLRFSNPEREENEHVEKHILLQEKASQRLLVEPDVSGYEPPKAPKGRKR